MREHGSCLDSRTVSAIVGGVGAFGRPTPAAGEVSPVVGFGGNTELPLCALRHLARGGEPGNGSGNATFRCLRRRRTPVHRGRRCGRGFSLQLVQRVRRSGRACRFDGRRRAADARRNASGRPICSRRCAAHEQTMSACAPKHVRTEPLRLMDESNEVRLAVLRIGPCVLPPTTHAATCRPACGRQHRL